jgi:hypothetical protein
VLNTTTGDFRFHGLEDMCSITSTSDAVFCYSERSLRVVSVNNSGDLGMRDISLPATALYINDLVTNGDIAAFLFDGRTIVIVNTTTAKVLSYGPGSMSNILLHGIHTVSADGRRVTARGERTIAGIGRSVVQLALTLTNDTMCPVGTDWVNGTGTCEPLCEWPNLRDPNSGKCTACEGGSIRINGVCSRCGYSFVANANYDVCVCGPGQFLPGGASNTCRSCPFGTHKAEAGNSESLCIPCREHDWGVVEGCPTSCPVGFKGNWPDCQLCEWDEACPCSRDAIYDPILQVCQCRAGFIGNGHSCTSCPANTAASESECISCDLLPMERASECRCGGGTWMDTNNGRCSCRKDYIGDGRTCERCAPGTYSNGDSCRPCNSIPSERANDCVCGDYASFDPVLGQCSCLQGFVGDGYNCELCSPGTFLNGSLCASCDLLPVDRAAQCICGDEASFNATLGRCSCQVGYSGDGFTCEECGPGTYVDGNSCNSCDLLPSSKAENCICGTGAIYNISFGGCMCTEEGCTCPVGAFFQNADDDCKCALSSEVPEFSADQCIPLRECEERGHAYHPRVYDRGVGRCDCPSGLASENGICSACPVGRDCTIPWDVGVAAGFYPVLTLNSVSYSVYPCPYPERCIGGSGDLDDVYCARPYNGFFCTGCLTNEGYVSFRTNCLRCPSPAWLPVAILSVVFAVFILAFNASAVRRIRRRQAPNSNVLVVSSHVILMTLQTLSLAFRVFSLTWTERIADSMRYLDYFALSPDMATPECFISLPYCIKWGLIFLVPLVSALPSLVAVCVWRSRAGLASALSLCVRAFLLCHLALAERVLLPFDCTFTDTSKKPLDAYG